MRDYSGNKNPAYKFIDKNELIYFIENGYSKTKISEHFNISYPCLNRKLKEYNIDWKKISTYNRKGENSPFYGKKHTEKYKRNQSIAQKKSFENGREPWNKGLTGIYSDETLQKMSKGRKGKKHSEESKEKMKIASKKSYENGRVGSMKGKKRSIESIEKQINTVKKSGKQKGKNNPMWGKFGKDNPNFGSKRTNEQKNNIIVSAKKAFKNGNRISPMKDKKHKPESKQKMRVSRIKEIEEKYGIAHPNYSLISSQYFHILNQAFGWESYHAENGSEYHIKELGYFIDYYNKNLNLIIEYDEAHHFNDDKNIKIKDKIREEEIINELNSNLFIRFREEHMKYEPSLLSQFACGII